MHVITQQEAMDLIASGKAEIGSRLVPDANGRVFVAVNRFDFQRIDYYDDTDYNRDWDDLMVDAEQSHYAQGYDKD